MNTLRVDLPILHQLRDDVALSESDRDFVVETAKLLEEGKGLNRAQILRVVDLYRGHLGNDSGECLHQLIVPIWENGEQVGSECSICRQPMPWPG
jgi:hypothetical protein